MFQVRFGRVSQKIGPLRRNESGFFKAVVDRAAEGVACLAADPCLVKGVSYVFLVGAWNDEPSVLMTKQEFRLDGSLSRDGRS